jgi:iron complex outermembrane receptor protein
MIRHQAAQGVVMTLAGMAMASAAQAQDAPRANVLDEIVVTAEKREGLLQDTPLAISAVSGSDLRDQQVSTIGDLAATLPSLDISQTSNTAMIAIRGVGSINATPASESQVAVHVDGVYVSRSWEGMNQLFDVNRIEYVRGPQGTLYGRNATAGALNILTTDPSAAKDGYVRVAVGNYTTVNLEGAANIPLAERWSARVAAVYRRHDGYDEDISSGRDVNNENVGAVRAKLKYDSEPFKMVLGVDYGRRDDHSSPLALRGTANPAFSATVLSFPGARVAPAPDIATDPLGFPVAEHRYFGASLNAGWLIGDNDVSAVLGYRKSRLFTIADLDSSNLPLGRLENREHGRQFSAELRYHRGVERYDVVVGGYYFNETAKGSTNAPLNLRFIGGPDFLAQGIFSGGEVETHAFAAFAQFRWNFSNQVFAEVGARYSHEEKEIDEGGQFDFVRPYSPTNPIIFGATLQQSKTWKSFDPKLTVGYEPSDNLLLFATVSRGFKSGGFNVGALVPPFNPERITDYEAGLKWANEDRTFAANLSVFYYKYSNMQVFLVRNLNLSIENAAGSTLKGVEAEFRWAPTDALNLGLSADLLDARYDEFTSSEPARPDLGVQDLSGNRLPQAPRYRIRFDATYAWSLENGTLSLRGQGTWTDRVYFSPYNRDIISAAPNSEFNAFLTYEQGDWTVQAYGRNLTDKRKPIYANPTVAFTGFTVLSNWNAPRTIGVSATRRW